ncbi:MAG: hypothetical protein HQK93_07930 [Nitrospirae bacterium]|nr:hypothetical protein [Nitrospirota bacterium]
MYKDRNCKVCNVDEKFEITICCKGKVYRIIDDFLGKTIFIGHEIFDNSMQLFTIYGHTKPIDGIINGRTLEGGEIVAKVSESKNIELKTHLHVTSAWMPKNIDVETLDWKTINNPQITKLRDPLKPLNLEPFE